LADLKGPYRFIMIIVKNIDALQRHLDKARANGNIGFVPTMGALHEGHLELIRTCRKENVQTIASIFVNPAQFNDPTDFQKYPVTIEKDILLLEKEECQLLFLPPVEVIYPHGFKGTAYFDLGDLDKILEGKFRPGHFQGVCKVVNRLLDIVQPTRLYLGQKDFQQCMVIQKLIELTKKNTVIRVCPTKRESDGLAMSSRNVRLSESQRKTAPLIHNTLLRAKRQIKKGSLLMIKQELTAILSEAGFRPDYFEFASLRDLAIKDTWDGEEKLVALVAAYLGEVRLIDNMIIN
jgi:pantoate--beta-alanine ligase